MNDMKLKEALKHVKVMLVQNQALAKIANVLESLTTGETLVIELGSKVEFLTKECKELEADRAFAEKEVEEAKAYAKNTSQMLKDKLGGELATNEQMIARAQYAAAEVVAELSKQSADLNVEHATNMAKLDEALVEKRAQLEQVKQDYEDFKSKF